MEQNARLVRQHAPGPCVTEGRPFARPAGIHFEGELAVFHGVLLRIAVEIAAKAITVAGLFREEEFGVVPAFAAAVFVTVVALGMRYVLVVVYRGVQKRFRLGVMGPVHAATALRHVFGIPQELDFAECLGRLHSLIGGVSHPRFGEDRNVRTVSPDILVSREVGPVVQLGVAVLVNIAGEVDFLRFSVARQTAVHGVGIVVLVNAQIMVGFSFGHFRQRLLGPHLEFDLLEQHVEIRPCGSHLAALIFVVAHRQAKFVRAVPDRNIPVREFLLELEIGIERGQVGRGAGAVIRVRRGFRRLHHAPIPFQLVIAVGERIKPQFRQVERPNRILVETRKEIEPGRTDDAPRIVDLVGQLRGLFFGSEVERVGSRAVTLRRIRLKV